jgi:hypothetical protein
MITKMWFLTSFLPDWFVTYFVHIIFVAGLIGTFAASVVAKVPFISNYGRLIQPIGMILLVVGLFLEGANWNERSWQAKLKDIQDKVQIAEQKSRDANEKLDEALKDKNKAVKEKQIVIQQKIKEVQVKVDAECKVAPEAIQILNDAARMK